VQAKNRAPYESLREQLSRADDGRGLPVALIHPDAVLKKVIATPSGLVIIDWTGAGLGPRLGPISLLIWSCALDNAVWSPERLASVVAGYRSQVDLQDNELARLADVMRVRPLIFACWRYRHAVVSGKQPNGTEWWMPSDELVDAISARARVGFEHTLKKA